MRVVDLFSGCGGMSLGFQQAGFEIISAFDNWHPAVRIYRENFAHEIYEEDISEDATLQKIVALEPDVVIGGPPCQDYSIAGKRKLGERANLTIRFAETVVAALPEWVVFENVYNIERYATLPEMKQLLSDAGYGLTTMVLDASHCGVPQRRKRFFLVGKLGAEDGFFNDELRNGQSENAMTIRDYFGESLDTEFYYMHPRSYNRRAVFSIDEPASTIRGINRPIPQNYKRHRADKAEIGEAVRALTTRERASIQTFPKDFVFDGPKTHVELAIGNAVPPALARFVATRIMEHGDEHKTNGDK